MTYLDYLIEQYRQATGAKHIDKKSPYFIECFSNWVKERNMIGEDYKAFLDSMGLSYYDTWNCAEVGKGKFDTIVENLQTMAITPADRKIDEIIDKDRIITGDLVACYGMPIVIGTSAREIPNSVIGTYMTQNPYSPAFVEGWESLHNSENNDIIVGVFGNTADRDRLSKIRQMRELKNKLKPNVKEVYAEYQDKYFYAVGSRIKTKVKVLSK